MQNQMFFFQIRFCNMVKYTCSNSSNIQKRDRTSKIRLLSFLFLSRSIRLSLTPPSSSWLETLIFNWFKILKKYLYLYVMYKWHILRDIRLNRLLLSMWWNLLFCPYIRTAFFTVFENAEHVTTPNISLLICVWIP